MTDPIVRFVSAPTVDATTRFDFHVNDGGDGRSWSDRQSWSWQPGALLGEPDGIGADYGLGRIDFTHYVSGTRQDALQTMGALARELQRDENYLLFQLDPSSPPMWLKTFRASPGALTFPYAGDPDDPDNDVWLLDVSLATESTTLGERESFTVTVTNDPAVGLSTVLPTIKGDAPAPLVVEFQAASTTAARPALHVTACDSAVTPMVWQAESGTLGADTTTQTSASYSGGSYAVVDLSASTSDVQRLSFSASPTTAGRWGVWAAVEVTGSPTAKATFHAAGTALVKATLPTEMSVGDKALVFVGEYAFPKGNIPPGDMAGAYTPASSTGQVTLLAARSGPALTTNLRVDYLLGLPIDIGDCAAVTLLAAPPSMITAGIYLNFGGTAVSVIDGEQARIYQMDRVTTPPTIAAMVPAQPGGDFPMVVPGQENVLTLLRDTGSGFSGSPATATTTLEISYQPRHVWLPS